MNASDIFKSQNVGFLMLEYVKLEKLTSADNVCTTIKKTQLSD